MTRPRQNSAITIPQARVEAIPTRGAPKMLLSVMVVALMMAMVASLALPRVLVA